MEGQGPAPEGVDVTTPNVARMYDYYLGGKDNYAADRAAAEQVIAMVPEITAVAQANRGFLGRAVRHAAESGIRQFIDLGTGLPTQENVHEVAHRVAPDARVVYVDYDPVVIAHGEALLATTDNVRLLQGDLRRPDEILASPVLRALIDLDRPVAVLLAAILHFVPDEEEPYALVARLRDAMVPGSMLILSHGCADDQEVAEDEADIRDVYRSATSPILARSRAEIARFFDGFELEEPGLVPAADWRQVSADTPFTPNRSLLMAGVGRRVG
ncbi:SAM-dependent methyltransferase [Streptomonospora nanhaiensis]|uniref:O-methyltransferase involved in polyketide biosynthesis n=1 Tax=Streptomonospora nanhaiensis TaxID=1323731 RepID=A0A853BF65_9ACTN|nr:SAM-dependent methyltransferase [Streptomonospora nanhaiensis]NYI94088.1 O-methyltransferase involved in polyketide biosynthesis [Streptomonospora nanhaiensis]